MLMIPSRSLGRSGLLVAPICFGGNERNLAILATIDGVAETVGATIAQVALAWQIARPSITAPIASATSIAQLDGLVAAARLRLDAASIATIDRSSAAVPA